MGGSERKVDKVDLAIASIIMDKVLSRGWQVKFLRRK
jgi:hypothetical protein